MRTTLALIAALLLLGLLGADFVRRVGWSATSDSHAASPWTAHYRQGSIPGTHTMDCVLQSFDGGLSTLVLRFTPDGSPRIAEVVIEQLALGGRPPQGGLPRTGTPDATGVVVLPCVFADVDWEVDPDAPRFTAQLEERCRVLYEGRDPADASPSSSSMPFWVEGGAGFADLVRAKGAPK